MLYIKRASGIFLVLIGVLLVAGAIILFARGYRPNFNGKNKLNSQGILVANSAPNNAKIYLNNTLYGVTPNNLYLAPGKYQVAIKKEGYNTWQKIFTIKGEVVSRTDTQLFSNNPSLSPLTTQGILAPSFSPTMDKIVYIGLPQEIETPNEENGGIFISNINSNTLGIFKNRSLLIPYSSLSSDYDLTKTRYLFSADERNLLAFFYDENNNLLNIKLTSTVNQTDVFDVTLSYETLLNKWTTEENDLQSQIINTFPKKIAKILNENTQIIEVSEDKTKILYFTLKDAKLTKVINPSLIGSVPTAEERNLKSGNYYIYDAKEDKNFLLNLFTSKKRNTLLTQIETVKSTSVLNLEQTLTKSELFSDIYWYSDSRHLVYEDEGTINIVEYDGQNPIVVYSAPFEPRLTGLTNDGKLIIYTNINPKKNKLADLYTVSIK